MDAQAKPPSPTTSLSWSPCFFSWPNSTPSSRDDLLKYKAQQRLKKKNNPVTSRSTAIRIQVPAMSLDGSTWLSTFAFPHCAPATQAFRTSLWSPSVCPPWVSTPALRSPRNSLSPGHCKPGSTLPSQPQLTCNVLHEFPPYHLRALLYFIPMDVLEVQSDGVLHITSTW